MTESAPTETATTRPPRISNGRLGFMLFLATETMLFAGLLSAHVVTRISAGSHWPKPTHVMEDGGPLMKWHLGAINTALLITASALVAAASVQLNRGQLSRCLRSTAVAAALGLAFLGVKAFEYREKIQHELVPAAADMHLPLGRLWSSHYFGLTGLHALHLAVGVVALFVILNLGLIGRLSGRQSVAMANISSYWQLVDVVWLVLFPMLYFW